MNRLLLVYASALGIALTSTAALAGTRQQAVNAAGRVTEVTERLASQTYGYYPNTSRYLSQMAQQAINVQETARFESRRRTARQVEYLVRIYYVMRRYASNIPNYQDREVIISRVRRALNHLILTVDVNGITVRRFGLNGEAINVSPSLDNEPAEQLNVPDSWDEEAGGLNSGGQGGGIFNDGAMDSDLDAGVGGSIPGSIGPDSMGPTLSNPSISDDDWEE